MWTNKAILKKLLDTLFSLFVTLSNIETFLNKKPSKNWLIDIQ